MKVYIKNPDMIHTGFGLVFDELNTDEYERLTGFWGYLESIKTTLGEEKNLFDEKYGNVCAFRQGNQKADYRLNGWIYLEFWSSDIDQIIAYCEMWEKEFSDDPVCNFKIEGL